MRSKGITVLILSGALLMSGCSMIKEDPVYELPSGAPEYTQKYFEDQDEYLLEINGRTYSYFGTLKNRIKSDSVCECIGYMEGDENARLYTLMEDPLDNYIMIRNAEGIMEQPAFYRAMDTRNKDILTPSYIESLGYECWSSSGLHYEEQKASIGVVCNAKKIREINYSVEINGIWIEEGGTRYGNFKELKLKDVFIIDIVENRLIDKVDMTKPFNVEMIFKVITVDGEEKEVSGVFNHDMMMGGYLNNLEIRYDDSTGYYLYENY